MLDFHIPTLDDKKWIDGIFDGTEYYGCFCTFATLWLWKERYFTEVAQLDDVLLTRGLDEEKNIYYMYPMGRSYDIRWIITALRENAAGYGAKMLIYCAEEWQCRELDEAFPGEFQFSEQRGDFDYIYRSDNLIHLSGKKFHAKRNHISKFMRNYPDWKYEDITTDNISECIDFSHKWLQRAVAGIDEEEKYELSMENSAITLSLRHFEELGMVGGILRVGDRITAMTIGEAINSRVFVTHFEKADTDYDDAYPMINNQFAINRLAGYEYINREEDMDKEGLRKAKLSYHPDILLKKFLIEDISGNI